MSGSIWWLMLYVFTAPNADHYARIMIPQSDESMCIFNMKYINEQRPINSEVKTFARPADCIKVDTP